MSNVPILVGARFLTMYNCSSRDRDKVTGKYIEKHQHNYIYDFYGNRKEVSVTKIPE